MLRNLDEVGFVRLLAAYNHNWETGRLLHDWLLATLWLLPKPGRGFGPVAAY